MFYSHLLLSKKGALGTVWIAAHCYKRLKKDQVNQTDISSSVDKILVDEVPVVTYRILAYLLLGLVRIYSKKVEYLFHDCHDVLAKLHDFKIEKSSHTGFRVSQIPYRSITLPKRFELDAFDLELLEDQDPVGGNVNSHEEVMCADGRRRDGSLHGLFYEENKFFSEAYSTACTPIRDVFSPDHVNHDSFASSSSNMNNSAASLEMLCGTVPSLEDHLDPMVLDEAEKLQLHDWLSNEDLRSNFEGLTHEMEYDTVASPSHKRINSITNLEKLHGTSLSLEHCLNPMVLSEAGKNSHDRPSEKEHAVIEELVDLPRTQLVFQEDKPRNLTELSNKKQPFDGKKMNSLEVIPTESRKCQINFPVSTTVDITSDSKLPEANVGTPEVATVKTPVLKERVKILKKRKMLFDDTVVVPNKVYKSWIDDSSNLICKRRKGPHNLVHAWRASKLCQIPHSFLEPLISSISIDFNSLECKKKTCTEPVQIVNLPESPDVAKSPVTHSSEEQTPIAPATPVTHLNSLRSHETGAVADSEILEPTTSLEIMEKQPASSEGMDLEVLFRDKLACAYMEAVSSEGDNLEKNKFSARTRMTGRYLYKNFLNKKRKKEDVLKLSELLAGKTKKESARLFYEILVLQTVNCIDVRQDNAYDDVLLWETSKLKQAFES